MKNSVTKLKYLLPMVLFAFVIVSCEKESGFQEEEPQIPTHQHANEVFDLKDYNYIKEEGVLSTPAKLADDIRKGYLKSELYKSSKETIITYGEPMWNLSIIESTTDLRFIVFVPFMKSNSITGIMAYVQESGHAHFDMVSVEEIMEETNNFTTPVNNIQIEPYIFKLYDFHRILLQEKKSNISEWIIKFHEENFTEEGEVEGRDAIFTVSYLVAIEEWIDANGAVQITEIWYHHTYIYDCQTLVIAPLPHTGPGGLSSSDPTIEIPCVNANLDALAFAFGIIDPCDPDATPGLDALEALCGDGDVSVQGQDGNYITVDAIINQIVAQGGDYVNLNDNTINGMDPTAFGYPPGTDLSTIPLEELCEDIHCETIEPDSELLYSYTITLGTCELVNMPFVHATLVVEVWAEWDCCVHFNDEREVLNCDYTTHYSMNGWDASFGELIIEVDTKPQRRLGILSTTVDVSLLTLGGTVQTTICQDAFVENDFAHGCSCE